MNDPLYEEFERQYAEDPLDFCLMTTEQYWRVFLAGACAMARLIESQKGGAK